MRDATSRSKDCGLIDCLASRGSIVHSPKGQVVFLQGSAGNSIFLVTRGRVKICVTSNEGKEVIIAIVSQGQFFGEEAIVSDDIQRFYNAVWLSDGEAIQISRPQLRSVLRASGNLAFEFLVRVLNQNRGVRQHLANTLLYSGTQRLIHALSSLEDKEERGSLRRINQQTLAEMVGLTRQYVNSLLKDLKGSTPGTKVLPLNPTRNFALTFPNSNARNRKA